ncbi:MAG: DUF255 domain-containing protein [Gammaproteobacteria bacterium]|nr:DUF255 domain-containing protein [Gammaproteobacteria bacterium]
MNMARSILMVLCFLVSVSPLPAYEHEESLVNFREYTEHIVSDTRGGDKPYFLLFSAEWCHWCHEFAENTLVDEKVVHFLNKHFVNVFIDVDIHNTAYVKYRATGVPYTVFLNPDGSLYYKYTGTLYGDDFLDVIKEVANEAGEGKYALGMESSHVGYDPPSSLDRQALSQLPDSFVKGVLENFDPKEHGLGKGQKGIQPNTFLYLLQQADAQTKSEAVESVSRTLERAIERIYDPVEGGFFRYAETRSWQIPHYEKFADLNATTVLLLYHLHQENQSEVLKQAADATLDYLTSTLWDDQSGTFLSFQVADTGYYLLSEKYRNASPAPKVMDKVFTSTLAATLRDLMRVGALTENPALRHKTRKSIDFLAGMVMNDAGMNRYYALENRQWFAQAGLSDHAHVAGLFTEAARHYQDARYRAVAAKVIRAAISDYYDQEEGIFLDPGVENNSTNAEYLMQMNGLIAMAMYTAGDYADPERQEMLERIITYFSQISEVLDERLWDAVDWDFTESYVPYLDVLAHYSEGK